MGGKKGGGSRSPRIDKNTLNSAQKLKVVDLISSGEIAGFTNGNDHPLKSVYLNDTPVQNEDGSMNHAGVQFEFNNGAIDQDYLPSLSSVDNSVSVGAQVEKKNPITRTVTNRQVTSIRVTVGVDALMRSTKEGDQLATSVDMSIQIIKNGEIYASEHMHLNEKGNQPFRLDFVFSKLPAAPFDIRCVRVTDDSNDDMLRNKTYFFSYVESIDIKVRMPGSAVAMLQIDSQQFGSNNPTRNYGLKGCIVQVPSNYDPVARTYTGLWDRLFKPAFTNNPAWVLYDVLTADECLGEKFKDYRIDIDRLYELSKQCDVLVDDGNGGKEPRFVCNMVLFGGDASTVLDNICSIFRGTYSSANNHFTVQFDQKSDPVAVYNNSSVENGEFNYSYVPATELFNQIKVEYIDKDDGYRTKIDEVSNESNIAKYGLRSTSITAFGATKRSYALRCAKWNLVTSLTENETVTFVLGAAGIRHEQHDIIKVADNDYAGAQIGGRIESVNGNTITVDRELK
ncbi:MAG: TipJ family phage tail tip protein, partial [Wohlfahrtiimonas sp.]